ncbi:MAG: hypothetical protein RIQ56_99 [Candidatus Parcubacteria bacterium]
MAKKLAIISNTMLRTLSFVLCSIFFAHTIFYPLALAALSADLSVTPVVLDRKAKPRDILNESISITNTSDRKLTLYPSVRDLNSVNGQLVFGPAKTSEDLADSLANWIELSRGVIELNPGEERKIPFTIRVNLNAIAGEYHAQISFASGGTRSEAETAGNLAEVMVNLEVEADIKEIMQLNSFSSDNIVLAGDDVVFKYQLQNIGNQELQPSGEIRIYNRKGEEVASVDVNRAGSSIGPDKQAQLASVWNGASGFGRFKALLSVNYGKGQTASVQDTVFFWIIPWKQLLALIVATLIAIAFFTLHFHRWFEEKHLQKLALSGMLKTHHLSGVPDVLRGTPQQKQDIPTMEAKLGETSERSRRSFSLSKLIGGVVRKPSLPFVPVFKAFDAALSPAKAAKKSPQTPVSETNVQSPAATQAPSFARRESENLASGTTIDLKKLKNAPTQAASAPQNHVIDLKRRP